MTNSTDDNNMTNIDSTELLSLKNNISEPTQEESNEKKTTMSEPAQEESNENIVTEDIMEMAIRIVTDEDQTENSKDEIDELNEVENAEAELNKLEEQKLSTPQNTLRENPLDKIDLETLCPVWNAATPQNSLRVNPLEETAELPIDTLPDLNTIQLLKTNNETESLTKEETKPSPDEEISKEAEINLEKNLDKIDETEEQSTTTVKQIANHTKISPERCEGKKLVDKIEPVERVVEPVVTNPVEKSCVEEIANETETDPEKNTGKIEPIKVRIRNQKRKR
eukprot:UN22653